MVAKHGGIYFDTDVELIKSPNALLQYEAFYGFENAAALNTGEGFGAVASHPTLLAMLEQYNDLQKNSDGDFALIGCPRLNTQALLPFGLELDGALQTIGGAKILPSDFFNPYDAPTGRLGKTENTISIHWYSGTWMNTKQRLRSAIGRPLHRLCGADFMRIFRK